MPQALTKHHKILLVIAIAICARLAILWVGSSIFFFDETGQIHGSTAYDEYANNLLETGVYGRKAGIPDANIPPLYSYVLAAVYGIFGRGGLQLGLFHTILDAFTILLVYQIVCRIFPEDSSLWGTPLREWVGLLSGLFYALYPYLIFQNLTLNDTAFFMLLMHAFIFLVIVLRGQEAGSPQIWKISVLAGIVLGITTLTRALLPLFAILTAIWFLFRLSFGETIRRLLPVALVSFLVLVPWMIRSYGIYHAIVPVALNTGDNLYQGANEMTVPLFRAGYDVQWSQPPAENDPDNWFRNNQLLLQAGMTYLKEHPEQIPELLWVKFLVHWSIDIAPRKNPLPGQTFALDAAGDLVLIDDEGDSLQDIETIAAYSDSLFDRVGRPVHQAYFGTLLFLALVGFWLSRKFWREVSLLWFLQISMTIMYVLFHPSTRYRVPTDPLLFAFSAFTIVVLVRSMFSKRARSI